MNESDRICHLAELGFEIARPNGYKPHAVERLFRESVKAITEELTKAGIEIMDEGIKIQWHPGAEDLAGIYQYGENLALKL